MNSIFSLDTFNLIYKIKPFVEKVFNDEPYFIFKNIKEKFIKTLNILQEIDGLEKDIYDLIDCIYKNYKILEDFTKNDCQENQLEYFKFKKEKFRVLERESLRLLNYFKLDKLNNNFNNSIYIEYSENLYSIVEFFKNNQILAFYLLATETD
ncbi:hypothetical protein HERIO_1821 [Hepatospora eriocheir]|uniref:Uncharacterized protein n=1 Tax=Hepatospora eriocheir TaxID=1081669 RepID=A0A1X0Q8W7_9MICR|nr:hypothetical protein HERIO_1821 [Hepatospora eriocheir]